jgi:hypothetical protein
MPLVCGCFIMPQIVLNAANIVVFSFVQEKKWFYEKKTKRQPGKPTAL